MTQAVASITNLAQLLASLVTAGLALKIYLEARRLRKIEWLSKTVGNWQDFNRALLEGDRAARWGAIKDGRVAWEAITQFDKQLIYMFLNILWFENRAWRQGLLDRTYAEKSVSDNIHYLQWIWPPLLAHLRHDGWQTEFLDDLDAVFVAPSETARP